MQVLAHVIVYKGGCVTGLRLQHTNDIMSRVRRCQPEDMPFTPNLAIQSDAESSTTHGAWNVEHRKGKGKGERGEVAQLHGCMFLLMRGI